VLGDVNRDGRLDALVGTNAGARLWINQSDKIGSGGPIFVQTEQAFKAAQTVWGRLQAGFSAAADKLGGLYLPYGSTRTKAVFLADLDGDGDLDALLARLWGRRFGGTMGMGILAGRVCALNIERIPVWQWPISMETGIKTYLSGEMRRITRCGLMTAKGAFKAGNR